MCKVMIQIYRLKIKSNKGFEKALMNIRNIRYEDFIFSSSLKPDLMRKTKSIQNFTLKFGAYS